MLPESPPQELDLDWEEESCELAEDHEEDSHQAEAVSTLTSMEEVLQLKQGIEELQDEVQMAQADSIGEAENEPEPMNISDISDESGLGQVLSHVDLGASCFKWWLIYDMFAAVSQHE